MPNLRAHLIALAVMFAAALVLQPHPALAEGRDLGLEDLLRLEAFGNAAFDPSGRWLVFERVRPYEDNTDFSFGLYAGGKSGHQLWRLEPGGSGEAERLPGIDPAPHTWIEGFSPDGRYLCVLQYDAGQLSLGAYDMDGEHLVLFDRAPVFSRTGGQDPVWLSGEELAYAAMPEGAQPRDTSVRAATGRALAGAWALAWSGKATTAIEVRRPKVPDAPGHRRGCLAIANARTGAVRCLADGSYTDLRLSPDRRYLAALSAMDGPAPVPGRLVEERGQTHSLVLYDTAEERLVPLLPDLEVMPYSLAWSPDGRSLALFAWARGTSPREGHFYRVDISSGEARAFVQTGIDPVSERERGWAQRPERAVFLGERLAVFARPQVSGEPPEAAFTYRDPGETGLVRADWYALSTERLPVNLTRALSDVSGVPLRAGPSGLVILAGGGPYRIAASGGITALGPDLSDGGGPASLVLARGGTALTRAGVIRPDLSGPVLLEGAGDRGTVLKLMDLASGDDGDELTLLLPETGATIVAGSVTAHSIVFRTGSSGQVRLVLATDRWRGEPAGARFAPGAVPAFREIARANDHLEGVRLGTWKELAYEVEDPEKLLPQRQVSSCLLLPPGHRPGIPLPLVVEVYPGASGACPASGLNAGGPDYRSPHLWAARGYAYTRLSLPSDLIRTEAGPIDGMPAIVEAGVDAIVAEGLADPGRIVLSGFSQGGISALYVAAHSDRFDAVIAQNSWSDLISHYFGPAGIFADASEDGLGAQFRRYEARAGSDFSFGYPPFDNPQAYLRNSPVILAPQIDCPVFLVHSDMDAFDIGQFDEMYAALVRAGKPVRYVRYRGEGHGLSSPANMRDFWDRMDDFLEEVGLFPPVAEQGQPAAETSAQDRSQHSIP